MCMWKGCVWVLRVRKGLLREMCVPMQRDGCAECTETKYMCVEMNVFVCVEGECVCRVNECV